MSKKYEIIQPYVVIAQANLPFIIDFPVQCESRLIAGTVIMLDCAAQGTLGTDHSFQGHSMKALLH